MIHFIYALNFFQQGSVWASRVVLSLFALHLGASPLTVGVLAALFSLFPATLAVAAGRLCDRYGAWRFLVLGSAGSGLGMFVPFLFPSLPSVLFAGAMSGLSAVFFNVATQSLTGQWSPPERRAGNFANYSLTSSGGGLCGPLLGGFAIEHASHGAACVLTGLFAMITLAMLLWRRGVMEPGGSRRKEVRPPVPLRETLVLLGDPSIRQTMITGSFLSSGQNLFQAYIPVYGHEIGLSASVIGILLALNSSASFVTRLALPRMIAWLKVQRVLAAAFAMGAGSLLLLPAFHSAWILGMLAVIFGLGMGGGQPIVTQLTYQNSPEGRSGESIGLKVTSNHVTNMVSPIVFGSIATHLGLAPMFIANGLMMACGSWMSWPKAGSDEW